MKRKIVKIHKHIASHVSFSWKESLKKLLVAWCVVFFGLLILHQNELAPTSATPQKIVFVLPGTPENRGLDPLLSKSHGAASDWDYLFTDDSGTQQIYQWNTGSSLNVPVSVEKDFFPVDEEELIQISESGNNLIYTGSLSWWQVFDLGTIQEWGDEPSLYIPKNCTAPWWETIAHNDFVLAYEQRTDVNTICNVQKRYCSDGKLTGRYLQKSCKQNEVYQYTKPEPIAVNVQSIDPFIQPSQPALSWASFDLNGKIYTNLETPIDVWTSGQSTGKPSQSISVGQTSTNQGYCLTPWWARIKNGQFVKAYHASIWLIDVPCETELRLCISGRLKWTFVHRTCNFKNMTYRDYLAGNMNLEKPTPGDLINALDTQEKQNTSPFSSFWKRLGIYN